MSQDERRIIVGKFGAPHGIRGEIRLKSYTEDPLAIADYESLATADGVPVSILSARVQGDMLVVRVEGCTDRDKAAAFNNVELTVERSELPELEDDDEFYLTDLDGLEARDPAGGVVGTVVAAHDFGAGTILEIRPAGRASFMLAFTRENVPEVDIAGGYLVVVLPAETEAREGRDDEGGK